MKSCPILSDGCFMYIAIFLIYYCKCFQKIHHRQQSLYICLGLLFVVDGKRDLGKKNIHPFYLIINNDKILMNRTVEEYSAFIPI